MLHVNATYLASLQNALTTRASISPPLSHAILTKSQKFCVYMYVYVCMNVRYVYCIVCGCMYVCTYVCTYVCMYVCTYVLRRTSSHGMPRYVCMHVCMHVCIHACAYVRMCAFHPKLGVRSYDVQKCMYVCM